MTYARTFYRGWLIVFLTALNVTQIAQRHYVGAFIVGTAISFVWVGNTRSVVRAEDPAQRCAYALGAGIGTVTGMFAGALVAWLTAT